MVHKDLWAVSGRGHAVGGRVWSGAPGGVRREDGLGYKDSNSRESHRAKKTGAGMEEG